MEGEVLDIRKKILEKLGDKNNLLLLKMFKYYCSCLGQYKGTCVWLYGNDGEGIRVNTWMPVDEMAAGAVGALRLENLSFVLPEPEGHIIRVYSNNGFQCLHADEVEDLYKFLSASKSGN